MKFLNLPLWTEPGYLGCFQDPYVLHLPPKDYRDRALSEGPYDYHDVNTANLCVEECKERGFFYAGVEYSDECYCGNQTEDYSRHGNLSDSECNFLCSGDERDTCGGSDKISVYQGECLIKGKMNMVLRFNILLI